MCWTGSGKVLQWDCTKTTSKDNLSKIQYCSFSPLNAKNSSIQLEVAYAFAGPWQRHSSNIWENPIPWEASCLLAASIFHTFKVLQPFACSVAAGTDVALLFNLLLAEQINVAYNIMEQERCCSVLTGPYCLIWTRAPGLPPAGVPSAFPLHAAVGILICRTLVCPTIRVSRVPPPHCGSPAGWVSGIKTLCNKSLAIVWAICTMCCFCQDPLPLGLELSKMKFLQCIDCPHGCSSAKLVLYIL